jgi:hypothetical protein
MRKQNAQRAEASQAADTGKPKTSKPDSKPDSPRLCAPMTGIRDLTAEALWAFDNPSSDDEGPAVAAVAPAPALDANGYLDDEAAYKLCCGPFSDDEQGPASDKADSLSDSLAEFYSHPVISAAVTTSAEVPDKPVEPAAETAAPAQPPPVTTTPAAEPAELQTHPRSQPHNPPRRRTSAAVAGLGVAPRASGVRPKLLQRRPQRRKKMSSGQSQSIPNLKAYFSPGAAKRVVDGKYQMTDVEREAFQNRDRTRQSKVVSIDQRNNASNLRCSTTATPR